MTQQSSTATCKARLHILSPPATGHGATHHPKREPAILHNRSLLWFDGGSTRLGVTGTFGIMKTSQKGQTLTLVSFRAAAPAEPTFDPLLGDQAGDEGRGRSFVSGGYLISQMFWSCENTGSVIFGVQRLLSAHLNCH